MKSGLRFYQDEMRRLIFPGGKTITASPLWKKGLPERLRVYRGNAAANWWSALDSDFPLTKKQFSEEGWDGLTRRYFQKQPPGHWELNASLSPFVSFLKQEGVQRWVWELADYEWNDLGIFIDRSEVKRGSGTTNPTAAVRVYEHQIFYWVEKEAPQGKPPKQKPEVLVFYRDADNTSHITEADPLMLLILEHFKSPGARLADLEPLRRRLLPHNAVPLESVLSNLKDRDLVLI